MSGQKLQKLQHATTGQEYILITSGFQTLELTVRPTCLDRPATESSKIAGLDFDITGNQVALGAFASLVAAKVHRNFKVTIDGAASVYAFDAAQLLFAEANETTVE